MSRFRVTVNPDFVIVEPAEGPPEAGGPSVRFVEAEEPEGPPILARVTQRRVGDWTIARMLGDPSLGTFGQASTPEVAVAEVLARYFHDDAIVAAIGHLIIKHGPEVGILVGAPGETFDEDA